MPTFKPKAAVDAASVDELRNPFVMLMADPDEPRLRAGWQTRREALMADALAELRAKNHHWWGSRPTPWWWFEVGCWEPFDRLERLRLLIEHGELQSFESQRIRRLAAEAKERLGMSAEQFSGRRGLGPDADAVALGVLLEELTA